MGTCVDPSHIPPHPPICLQPPVRDDKRTEVRGGGAAAGHLLPLVPRPHSLTALTLHICQIHPVISDGPPFYRENAPVGALKSEMSPPLGQWSFGWGGGGGVTKGRNEAWRGGGVGGGGWGGKSMCGLKTPPLLGKNSQSRYTWSCPRFFPRWLHPLIYL